MFKKGNKGDLNGPLAIIIILMALVIISVSLDVAKMQWQKFIINNQLTFVSKIAGRQGGILRSAPEDYDKNLVDSYNSSDDVWDTVSSELDNVGAFNYRVTVGGIELPRPSPSYDFQDEIEITITANIPNTFIGKFFGGNDFITIQDTVLVASEKWQRWNLTLN